MLRVLAGLPATLPSGFPFKLTKWRWLRGATKFFIERFDVDSANGPDKKKEKGETTTVEGDEGWKRERKRVRMKEKEVGWM